MPNSTGSVTRSFPTILSGSTAVGAAAAAPLANANTMNTAAQPDYVNYVDIKLEGIYHLPSDWLSAGASTGGSSTNGAGGQQGSAPAGVAHLQAAGSNNGKDEGEQEVAYAFHPFRYEVNLSLPAEVATTGTGADVQAQDVEWSAPTMVSVQSPSVNETNVSSVGPASSDAAEGALTFPPYLPAGDGRSPNTTAAAASTVVVASFKRGRVLQPLPSYTAYIHAAAAPPIHGVDDTAPLRDVPAAIDADDVRRVADSMKESSGMEGKKGRNAVVNGGPTPPAEVSTAGAANGQEKPEQQAAILWIVTDRTDGVVGGNVNANNSFTARTSSGTSAGSSGGGLVAAKRRLKPSTANGNNTTATGGGGSAAAASINNTTAAGTTPGNNSTHAALAAAAVPGAPPPPLPDPSEAPPCVVRVPLTAAQEAHLDTLLNSGAALELRFRRTLRLGCPAEWEDLNAVYYEAVIPVPLQGLSVPGSTLIRVEAPLQPAYLYDAGRANSVMGAGAVATAAGSESGASVAASGGGAAAPTGRSAAAATATPASGDHQDRNNNNNNNKKRAVTRKARQTVPGLLVDEPDRSAPHPYVVAGTTAVVTLSFQRTLTRLVSDRIRPTVTPAQLIPARPVPTVAVATATDVQVLLQHTLREIAHQLLRDVNKVAQQTMLKSGSIDGDGQNSSSKSSVDTAAWRTQLVAVLQSTGQLATFKSRLTPLVTRLVQERMRVQPSAAVEEVARASNELYVQLMDMLHGVLCEILNSNSNAAGENASADGQPEDENEERDNELRWRALEAEMSGEVTLATTLYHSRLATHAGDAASWAALWVDCAVHYQRTESFVMAEQCYREAIACDCKCVPALLDYGLWLLAHDRVDEASVFLHGVVDVAPTHVLGWGAVGLLADLRELAVRLGSPNAAAEQAKWHREHNLALRRAVECFENEQRQGQGKERQTVFAASNMPTEERVYWSVAAYLVQLHHRDLANVCLARCRPGEPLVELLYAQLFTQGGQYAEALKALDEIPNSSGKKKSATETTVSPEAREATDTCVLLRAECMAATGHSAEAVMLYKQGLAHGTPSVATTPSYLSSLAAHWRDDAVHRRTTNTADSAELAAARTTEATCAQRLRAYIQLCNTLLAEGRYKDALGAVTLALPIWPNSSVLWLGAGIAYYRAGDLAAAEECLQESNTLNPSNARAWVYLVLLSIRLQHTGVEEMVQQLVGLNLEDAALWAELGRTLLNTARYPKLSILCLRRAASLARAQAAEMKSGSAAVVLGDASSSSSAFALLPSTLYHLAHALMDVQQWTEAERLLREVAAEGGGNEVLRCKAEEELAMLRAA